MNSGTTPNGARALWWYALAILVIGLDQYTKALASSLLDYGRPVEVFFWFDLTLQHNTGAAFSLLADAGGWQRWLFTIIAIVISIVIVQWLRRLPPEDTITAVSLGLILGGAVGNLIDRILLGHVIDFIQVWLGSYPFPAFNIADSAISIGAVLLILGSFIGGRRSDSEEHNEQDRA